MSSKLIVKHRNYADRKIIAVDFAFRLPRSIDRTQPGAVGREEPKGGKRSGVIPKLAKPEPNRRAKTNLILGRAGNFG